MVINFLRFRKIYFIFSGILILISLFAIFRFGFNPGIDFTGGSILEVEYQDARPSVSEIREMVAMLELGEVSIQPAGEKNIILRMRTLDENDHQKVLNTLGQIANQVRFESVGPTIGMELRQKTTTVAFFAILAMVFYIALVFRRVSRPVKSWQYGVITLFILTHDVLIPLGVFALLGNFYNIQITIPVIVALLTVIGYAINNVVVVFDRIRENLLRRGLASFEETVNFAINQTLTRQLNTSLTTLLPLIFIFFVGGETLKYFALALIIGIVTGLYSSLFLASPILVSWLRLGKSSVDKGK